MADKDKIIALGKAVLENEAQALAALSGRVDNAFYRACELMLACKGRIIVTGMGKSGHVAGKIAATFASTGTPSFFVHPGEASHGDLGMITNNDVVVALSNSGETNEIIALVPVIKRLGVKLIVLSGNPDSSLARDATVFIDTGVDKEACPLGLAPTTSTTAALAMGDALAVALLEHRGFNAEDFAMSHPGGVLGRRLLIRVIDIMHTDNEIPVVDSDTILSDALVEMSKKGLGVTVIIGKDESILGVFTDGDIRRVLDTDIDIKSVRVGEHMTINCKTISADALAAEALKMMNDFKINAIPVTDKNGLLIGILNMHDLLRANVV
ncbi:MAG: KpsF/GutQ family sugar-phosphate isomerase [Gammaproteobacteria bacterium]|nr:KpsF/GutQ family sugar-phosphate isomerase [Gammaproteobacteria bacterium]